MAKRTYVMLVDDLTGEELNDTNGVTVSFSLDGAAYSIDLSSSNADKLRTALAPYVAAATKVGRKARPAGGTNSSGASAREIRDWARAQGLDVPDRGRIPESVRAAFQAAV